MQALFTAEGAEHGRKLFTPQVNGNDSQEKPHTLEEYALDHFRYSMSLHYVTILPLNYLIVSL